jgi:hypothetical protein
MIAAERVRELVSSHGTVRSQAASEWTGEFPLPPELEQFYRQVGPDDVEIDGCGNPILLPSLAGLWALQAGYRWHGSTGVRLDEWDDDWLVVATEGGDPYIFARSSGRIMTAIHGAGEWDPSELFDDLNIMAASFSVLGTIVKSAGLRFSDEQGDIRSEHRSLAQSRLAEVLSSPEAIDAVLGALGWG